MSCFHGGLGEAGGSQALFELPGFKHTGGSVARRRSAWTSSPSAA